MKENVPLFLTSADGDEAIVNWAHVTKVKRAEDNIGSLLFMTTDDPYVGRHVKESFEYIRDLLMQWANRNAS